MQVTTKHMSNSTSQSLLFLSCCCWCSCFLLLNGSAVAALNVGAVINPNSQDGIEQMIAMEVAAEQFNNSASPLFLSFRNSSLGAAATVEDLIGPWRADVVLIGAHTWTEEALAGEMRNTVQIPVISFPTGPSLAPATSWPYLVRMSDKFSSQIQCIVDLVGNYSWRRVVVLYEDDGLGGISVGSISLLSKALQGIGSDVERYKAFPRYDSFLDPTTTIREGLQEVNGSKCRVFVVLRASPLFATDLFKQATNLGMMTEGYVWITNDGITRRLNSSVMSPYTQGVVELRNFANQSDPFYKNFLTNFRRRYTSEIGTDVEDVKPEFHALLAYDAIQTIAIASGTSKKDDTTMSKQLSSDDIATSTGFKGLSGYIRFQNRELLSDGTTFTIVNVVGSGVREMGNWSKAVGFHKNREKGIRAFGSVYWPGGPSWIPGGWDVLDVLVPVSGTFPQFTDTSDNTTYSGLSIEVFEAALRKMPYHLRINYHRFPGKYDDMLKEVHSSKTYSAAIGDITIMHDRLKYVDFTVPYMDSGLSKVVPLERVSTTWMFVKPFTWKMWFGIAMLSIYTGFIVWWLERGPNPGENGRQPERNQIAAGLWFACSAIFFSHGNLYSNFARVAVLVWLFVALVITQSYTASLSSILTVQKLQPKINNQGLMEQVGCSDPSFILDYLQSVLEYKRENIHTITSEEGYPEAFRRGNFTAAFLETPYIRIFLSKNGKEYTVTGETYKLGGFGFAFDKGSPLTRDVSSAILNLTEDGTLKRLTAKTFALDLFSCPGNDPSVNRENLDIDSFWVLFLISAVISAIVAILVYVLRSFHRRDVQTQKGNLEMQKPPAVQPHRGDLEMQNVERREHPEAPPIENMSTN